MPFTSADYVEVTGVTIDDGHGLEYANFLAENWVKDQAFAKSKGWITGYEVLVNSFPRKGEPDVYLITRWAEWATPADEEARAAAYREYKAKSMTDLQKESGMRAEYRHVESSMLLRAMTPRN
ncbi:hypothetical protein GCM10010990_10610 [Croceicoccus mobilis]|uniref:Uncharacterized protein n=2 Tax=Croceicoccus mobilis TaxID=1703339 RepID=A0A917DSP9_9SPHN|nr:hypothetical protein GCM10010990_10610 [Croceicoccus mobilis]